MTITQDLIPNQVRGGDGLKHRTIGCDNVSKQWKHGVGTSYVPKSLGAKLCFRSAMLTVSIGERI